MVVVFDDEIKQPIKSRVVFDDSNFEESYSDYSKKYGINLNPDDPKHFYDYRALYRDTGKIQPNESGHLPSKYKKEGHHRMVVDGVNTKTGKVINNPKSRVVFDDEVQPVKASRVVFDDEPTTTPISQPSMLEPLGKSISSMKDTVTNIFEPIVSQYKAETERRNQFDISKATGEQRIEEMNRRFDPKQWIDSADPAFVESKSRLIDALEPDAIPGHPYLSAAKGAIAYPLQLAASIAPLTPKEIRNVYVAGQLIRLGGMGIVKGTSVAKNVLGKTATGQKVLENIGKMASAVKKYNVNVEDLPLVKKVFGKAKNIDDVLVANLDDIYKDSYLDITKPSPMGKMYKPETFNERGFIKTVRESKKTAPQVKAGISGETTVRSTEKLEKFADNLVKNNFDEAVAVSKNLNDEGVAVSMKMIEHYQNIGDFDSAIKLVDELAPKLTEMGRSIQAVSLYNKLSPRGIVKYAQNQLRKAVAERPFLKLKSLDAKQAKYFYDTAKSIQKMPNTIEKQISMNDLMGEIDDLVPDTLSKQAVTLWKAGLLTGLKTHGVNTASNAVHAGMEMSAKAPASVVDRALSLFTGKRTTAFTVKGYMSGFTEGIGKAGRFLKTGFDERNVLSKYDFRRVSFGRGPLAKSLRTYEQTIFRTLGAEDQPWYYGAKARSIYEQAKVAGMNSKLKGKELAKYVDDIVKNPTDDIIKNAVNDAQVAVYQNKTAIGTLGSKAQKAGPIGEFLIPFSRTPSAVAMETLNYSPFGVVKTVVSNIGRGRFDQRDLANMLGKNITGTGIFYVGSELRESGRMNLGYPKSQKERELWQLEGRIPNSIKVGGRWININALGPAGYTMILGGYFRDGLKETGSTTEALGISIGALPKTMVDQTYLQNVGAVIKAMDEPDRWGKNVLANLAGSAIPAIVSNIATAKDSHVRDTKRSTMKESVFTIFQSRIPGAREKLLVKRDAFGQPIKPDVSPIVSMIDIFRSRKGKGDDTVQELRRLSDNKFNATPIPIKEKIDLPGVKFDIPPKERNVLEYQVGTRIKKEYDRYMKTGEYKKVDDETKSKLLTQISGDIKHVNLVLYAKKKGYITDKQLRYFRYEMSTSQKRFYKQGLIFTMPVKLGQKVKENYFPKQPEVKKDNGVSGVEWLKKAFK